MDKNDKFCKTTGKIMFKDRNELTQRKGKMKQRGAAPQQLHQYKCKDCGCWHYTSREKIYTGKNGRAHR